MPAHSGITWHDNQPGIQRLPSGKRAPYWKGKRAELIVADRVTRYAEEKKNKRKARGTGAIRLRTPQQQLRRLERALAKRKTLAARQRIAAEIKALKQNLGA